MARKNITIQSIDEELYSEVKKKAAESNKKISDYVEEVFKGALNPEKPTIAKADFDSKLLSDRVETLSSENASLKEKISSLEKELEAAKEQSDKEQSDVERELALVKKTCEELSEERNSLRSELKTADKTISDWEEKGRSLHKDFCDATGKIAELETELEKYRQEPTRGIVVEMPELETKLIHYVCERESERVGRKITPALLLQTMFVNFAFHGDTWFFPIPKKSVIRKFQDEIEATKAKEEAGDE